MTRGVGASVPRPDGPAKARGEFDFASDLWAPGMIYGRTLRSPYPHALIRSVDTSRARSLAGVRAVLTADDLPGQTVYGLAKVRDQPVLVGTKDRVMYEGEAIALVAADTPEIARLALELIDVQYEPLPVLTDPVAALIGGDGYRELVIRRGDPDAVAAVQVEGYYEVGQQDQAPLGPEAGLAVPSHGGREVDLFIATQALHVDLDQVADCLAMERSRVRLHLAGVGGAFGAREDISMQIHACLLALATMRPVKMWYGRQESFFGHVHRHPARMWYRHGADASGQLVFVRATIVLDGGAYGSSTRSVVANAACFGAGPYRVPNVELWCGAARTNVQPNGAMRGFGAVQACFAHEAQMDRLAHKLELSPLEIRRRNLLGPGDSLITGQRVTGAAPLAELLDRCQSLPLPSAPAAQDLPGAGGYAADPRRVRRGVGYALGYKNIAFSGGTDDYSTARVRLELVDGRARATVKTAASEMGQGLVTVVAQMVRTELGVDEVILLEADTLIGDAGSSSASRQTWMTGGAVQGAARRVKSELLRRAGPPAADLGVGCVLDSEGVALAPIELVLSEPIEFEHEFHHRPTQPLDDNGQGDAHVSFMFVAQRAVVDVDLDTGCARVAQVATVQDVGRAINPLQVMGQIEGAVAQGVGLALMEEMLLQDGHLLNPSFTDYLLPTVLDTPEMVSELIEEPEPLAPYGAKGVGEPPLIASPAAIAAALRDASGRSLPRIPVRAEELAGIAELAWDRRVVAGQRPGAVLPEPASGASAPMPASEPGLSRAETSPGSRPR
ncbi:MAG TPA: molybdopterin cofactor-binding domain-containing protein [Candidatus Nitrosotalea sp.]|nr:molybdopterin cofactor-binding domain-containing protein [Candidatus Nitrosotalea sp.]